MSSRRPDVAEGCAMAAMLGFALFMAGLVTGLVVAKLTVWP